MGDREYPWFTVKPSNRDSSLASVKVMCGEATCLGQVDTQVIQKSWTREDKIVMWNEVFFLCVCVFVFVFTKGKSGSQDPSDNNHYL